MVRVELGRLLSIQEYLLYISLDIMRLLINLQTILYVVYAGNMAISI